MKSISNKYNFNQNSPHGKFGFEAFKNEEENKFYFHFNNLAGEVVLFSQAYTSARSRDNGLSSVHSNALNIDRFSFQTKNGKHYFSLVAGNNQEIARSPLFDQKEEMEAALSMVMQIVAGEVKTKGSNSKNSITKSSPAPEQSTVNDTVAQTKSRITIDFYRNKTGESLKGRIEHPLSGAKLKFQGYDRNIILNFIEQHIPSGIKHHPQEAELKAQLEENLPGIYTIHKGIKSQFISAGASFDIVIPIPNEVLQFTTCSLEIHTKQLGKSQIDLLGKETLMLSSGDVSPYTVENCNLATGTYRLLVKMYLKNEEKSKEEVLKGSCLLLVQ